MYTYTYGRGTPYRGWGRCIAEKGRRIPTFPAEWNVDGSERGRKRTTSSP